MLDADAIRWTVKVSPAVIRSALIEDFEAMSANGRLSVDVENIGTLTTTYYVEVNCSDGIAPVPAQPLSLSKQGDAGSSSSLSF